MKLKLTVGMLMVWAALVAVSLLNATFGLWVDGVDLVLRPLPLVFLLGCLLVWFQMRPAISPERRFALMFGLLLFAAGDVALVMTEQAAGILLYFCGFLAYGVWAARGISTDQWRWVLIVPVAGAAMLMVYWLWPVYGLPPEAVVAYTTMIGTVTVLLLISPILPWWAVAGPILLIASQGLWAANEFLAGVPHATLAIMGTYYLAHLLLIRGALSHTVELTKE